MIPMLRHVTLFTILGLGALAVPATAQGLALGLHKHGGHKVELDFRYVIGRPGHAYARGAAQQWIPGHYACVEQRYWVPGTCEQVWVPARYELDYDACGRAYRRLICAGHWQTIEQPGHWETREVRQWVEGHWEVRHARG